MRDLLLLVSSLYLSFTHVVKPSICISWCHSCSNVSTSADYKKITLNALNTYTLGGDNSHIRQHKVLGTTVKAIIDDVYHQFICPSILFPFSTTSLNHLYYLLSRVPQKLTSSSTHLLPLWVTWGDYACSNDLMFFFSTCNEYTVYVQIYCLSYCPNLHTLNLC